MILTYTRNSACFEQAVSSIARIDKKAYPYPLQYTARDVFTFVLRRDATGRRHTYNYRQIILGWRAYKCTVLTLGPTRLINNMKFLLRRRLIVGKQNLSCVNSSDSTNTAGGGGGTTSKTGTSICETQGQNLCRHIDTCASFALKVLEVNCFDTSKKAMYIVVNMLTMNFANYIA